MCTVTQTPYRTDAVRREPKRFQLRTAVRHGKTRREDQTERQPCDRRGGFAAAFASAWSAYLPTTHPASRQALESSHSRNTSNAAGTSLHLRGAVKPPSDSTPRSRASDPGFQSQGLWSLHTPRDQPGRRPPADQQESPHDHVPGASGATKCQYHASPPAPGTRTKLALCMLGTPFSPLCLVVTRCTRDRTG